MAQADIISSKYNRVDCLKAAIQLFYDDGNYEEVINHETGKTKKYHYIHGGSGLAAVFIAKEDSAETDNLYYIHKDYLGSVLALTNQKGSTVERYSFDAWGHRRNPTNWSQWQEDSTDYIVNRGFTGHVCEASIFQGEAAGKYQAELIPLSKISGKHMDIFGLINMSNAVRSRTFLMSGNGRVYDPDLGRFISPVPYVQMPDNSQNFNRYSYALNNPLKYTDPSGYNIQPHPRYDNWEKNITGAGRGFMRAFNQYGYMSSDQLGTPQLAYGYDWSTGTYRNNEGSVVSWYDVKDNMFNSNSSYDTYALFQTAFRNENDQWVGTGNFGVIKEGLYKSTGLYPTFTVYSNALNFASGMESGLGGSEGNVEVDLWNSISNHLNGASFSAAGIEYSGSRALSRTMAYVNSASTTTPTKVMFKVPGGSVYASTRFVSKATKVLKFGGAATGFLGMGMTGYEIGTGQKDIVGEGGLDLIMGGVTFIPGGGWIASGIYFGGKFTLEYTGNDFWNE